MVKADLLFLNNLECFHSDLKCEKGSGLDAQNILRRLEHPFYEKRLREMGLSSLENRRLTGNLTVAFQYLQRAYKRETKFICGQIVIGQKAVVSN